MTGQAGSGAPLGAFFREAGPRRNVRDYRDKEVIYSQGDSADAIFYIKRGLVKLTIKGRPGGRKQAVLAILTAGAVFGEGCLVRKRARRMSTATSIGSSTITRVEKAAFWDRIEREPILAALFIRYLISQAVLFKLDLADHRLNAGASERRLARLLVAYSTLAQNSPTGPSTHLLSQSTLAEIVGTTRSRINIFMNKFKRQGYVRYNGGLEIDAEGLRAFLQR